jgi:hypothetical protein
VNQKEKKKDHFHGKAAMQHIVEVQADGRWIDSEIHGAETPGMLFAGCDAARQGALFLLLVLCALNYFEFSLDQRILLLLAVGVGLVIWATGRAAWLAWSRLERLHRVMDEEQNEIETNREQERIELEALYAAKGFEGKLLKEVVDVLMADGDRLLRVMLEEEMGFRLQQNEHPLMQGIGAALGSLLAICVVAVASLFSSLVIAPLISLLFIGIASFITAKSQKNNVIAAMSWNVGMALVSYLATFFCMKSFVG